jgi:NSS family neurotransmitter:Na+ symporter
MVKVDVHINYVHAQWSSRWVFVLAATGSAVGLGNIWKFPYMVGQGGGGAFVLVYLVCIVLIGIPIMMSEVLLGRRARRSPVNTMRVLAQDEGASPAWQFVGWLGMATGFMILSFYGVVAGWTLAYVFRSASGLFAMENPERIKALFGIFVTDPQKVLVWHSLFMVMTTIIVARGVQAGLEKAVKFMMPVLFILLLALVFYSMGSSGFDEGFEFLFKTDFNKLTPAVILGAMGQAFFSLSLGMGAILIYGSYLPQRSSIAGSTFMIVIADTVVALLAGLAVFPIVFANGLEPAAGPPLIFETLPIAFGQMPGGVFWGTLFFVLLVFAAWTSAISLIEPAVAWLTETRGLSRTISALLTGGLAWLLGILTIMSFSDWAFSFRFLGVEKTNGFFDIFDILTTNITLPLGGILIVLFAGWIIQRDHSREELNLRSRAGFEMWLFLSRFVSPVLVGILLMYLLFGHYFNA